MRPNHGQWHDNVAYKIDVPGGYMYLEEGGFTYQLVNPSHYHERHAGEEIEEYDHHVIKTKFLGANPHPSFVEIDESEFYENYFIGNNPDKWATHVHAYQEIQYSDLYDGIGLKIYQHNQTLKYDIIVQVGTDPSVFKVKYEGQDDLKIRKGTLIMETHLGRIIEGKPLAYQIIDGTKTEVECHYQLIDDVMSFSFPDGFDDAYELIIDPDLTFSTFTGSTSDNWGMTACPDINKNLIAAGIVRGTGYPTTAGAFDVTFNGGTWDIGLTKFNETGSSLIYSTFIGGGGGETPASVIVNSSNQLYIMGATSSADFPIPASGYQTTFKGGSGTVVNGIEFASGSDLYVLKLSPDGSTLMGGTYLGGTANDAVNTGATYFNYGDQLRGEVMIDAASNVYVSSTSKSSDFPIAGGGDATLGGSQDAVVAKLSPDLTSLIWSSYLGGTGIESGNSVQVDGSGNIFVAGGTTSSNFPNTAGKIHSSYLGGSVDGYVYKFVAPTYATSYGTYLGTGDYDQTYFVQLDPDDKVYAYGQTRGDYSISAGVYNNPSSGQFIHKMSNDLATTEWSSTFGSSSGNEELSPTAFLVSDCYEIYIAGWGGEVNSSHSSAVNSSSSGMPITGDAFMATTNGNNFYLALFTEDMATLKYGTYMGSLTANGDHVDGGTSRFDKGGGVYHAVCAACGATTFPTTPGAWSTENGSGNCNMAAFLFELQKIEASISIGSPVVCIPDPVFFENDSENGDTYFWDFGDGETSTDFSPTHYYEDPGVYTVMLVVSHSSGCYTPDTTYIEVTIELMEAIAGTLNDTICPGSSVELWAIGGSTYSWGPAEFLDDPSSSNPIATIWESTTFTVTVESECGISEVEVTVWVHEVSTNATGDTAICVGGTANLSASGGISYLWIPGGSLDDPTSANPVASPPVTTYYFVTITTEEGCEILDTVKVHVDQDLPYPNLIDEVTICKGESIQIAAHGATSYEWYPDYNISDPFIYNPFVSPDVDTTYHVTFTNACGSTYDSVFVEVIEVIATISPDTTLCPGQEATLWASGGDYYEWSPTTYISNAYDSIVTVWPWTEVTYTCVVTDEHGCYDIESVNIDMYPKPTITVGPDVYAIVGDSVQLWAEGPGIISWTPADQISCAHCTNPYVFPDHEQTYVATVTDANGCQSSAPVTVYFDPLIYVPNVFTLDGNSINPVFFAVASNIEDFEMLIFNRWGEVVWKGESLDASWDGTYHGVQVKDDVYVWQITYRAINGEEGVLRGHVAVLK